MNKVLIRDLRRKEYIKFVWSDCDKQKYLISIKALRKAEKENKINIIYDEVSE